MKDFCGSVEITNPILCQAMLCKQIVEAAGIK
jgi:hypothetical protein